VYIRSIVCVCARALYCTFLSLFLSYFSDIVSAFVANKLHTSCAACSGAATMPPPMQVVSWTATQRAYWPWPLTFDFGPGAECQLWHGKPSCQFRCFCDILLSSYGQQCIRLTTWRRPTLTFVVWRHCRRHWCGSSGSISYQVWSSSVSPSVDVAHLPSQH